LASPLLLEQISIGIEVISFGNFAAQTKIGLLIGKGLS